MKKYIILGAVSAFLLVSGVNTTFAEETTASKTQAEKLAQIQELMKLIADLQAKLAAARGEVQELMTDLSVGAQSDDVKKVQEILASDPSIFAGKATGYFGPMTEAGLKKLQERYGLEVTGKLDKPTRDLVKELRQERKNGMVPPGLVKSEEVKERIKTRLQEKWKDCDFEVKFRASVCEKVKEKKEDGKNDDDEDEDEDDKEEVTRDDARRAVVDAQNELNTFRDSIDDMEDDDASEDEIDEALDTLKEAQKKMIDARRALARRDFDKAYESAQDVLEVLEGDDDSDDDDSDDEDDDEEDDD